VHLRLRPRCRREVEDDEIGEVRAVLILAAEDEQLVALPQRRCVPCEFLS
jgi:hypothetical protein